MLYTSCCFYKNIVLRKLRDNPIIQPITTMTGLLFIKTNNNRGVDNYENKTIKR